MATEAEMMADLAAADAAGDTQLAQHIAGLIKQARSVRPAAPGRGEFQEAEGRREITDSARNIPAAMLTPDPITNRMMAEKAWEQGHRAPVTPIQVAKAGAATLGALMVPMAGAPAAAISSGLIGGGTSSSDDPGGVLKDAGKSAATGYGLAKAVPLVAGKVAEFAGKRLGAAAAKATAEQAAERTSKVRSAAGTLGNARTENNRVVEAIRELLANPALSEADKVKLQGLQGTPEYAAALSSLTHSLEERLPQVAGRVATGEQAVASANALPSVEEMVAQRLSPATARTKVMDRVKRYWLPVAGGALGYMSGGLGLAGVGALAGRGASPTVQALWRMTKDPAVQTQIWTPVERLAAAMAQRPAVLAGPSGPALSDPFADLLAKAMGRPRGLVPVAATEEAPK